MIKRLPTKSIVRNVSLRPEQTDCFYTYDLGCAAALMSLGFDLLSLERTNPRKVQFQFQKINTIDESANDYFLGKLEIKARLMFDNIKTLKNMIYSS